MVFISRNASGDTQTKHSMQSPKQQLYRRQRQIFLSECADLVVLKSTRQLDIPAISRITSGLFTIAVHFQLNCVLGLSLHSSPLSKSCRKKQLSIYQTLGKMRGSPLFMSPLECINNGCSVCVVADWFMDVLKPHIFILVK